MKILFAGGGTLGPVTPLLAVADAWRKKDSSITFVWVGTKNGPERVFIEKESIPFFSLTTARFPRYPSFEWIFLPFRFFLACLQASLILLRERPQLIAAAGGYTSVPLILIGRILGIPSWIHQSDVLPVLTNRLLSHIATVITVAWPQTQNVFPKSKTYLIGNPVRASVLGGSREHAKKIFAIDETKPTILVFGGGSGARFLNHLMSEIWKDLSMIANVIHVTGKGKMLNETSLTHHYHVVEYLAEEMKDAYALADLVVCRAGTGTITELAALKKAAILIPLLHHTQ
ncbi:MAG: UDP-N-acetylglucosamine--N-acetylmuramyl-(pentapeptide) pyrophosphoryl-undecaprenol N-acetylglucosamine transferase, partial [Patescibacteria group bacterium]